MIFVNQGDPTLDQFDTFLVGSKHIVEDVNLLSDKLHTYEYKVDELLSGGHIFSVSFRRGKKDNLGVQKTDSQ